MAWWAGPPRGTLEPAAFGAFVADVEHQFAELDRRPGNCALCKAANPCLPKKRLRVTLNSRPT